MDTDDIKNIEKRLEDAQSLKANLESKLEKLGDNPRAETFQIQLDKVNDLIDHLEKGIDTYTELGAISTDNYEETKTLEKPSYINFYRLDGTFVSRVSSVDTNTMGKYLLVYMATDSNGNVSNNQLLASKKYVIVRDTTAPEVSARITVGRTYITGKDVTELQYTIYKDGAEEPVYSYNTKDSTGGKTFSLNSTTWFGEGNYTNDEKLYSDLLSIPNLVQQEEINSKIPSHLRGSKKK